MMDVNYFIILLIHKATTENTNTTNKIIRSEKSISNKLILINHLKQKHFLNCSKS